MKINPEKLTPIFRCEYCGNFTTRYHHKQKYCHPKLRKCKHYARLEYKNKWQKEYNKKNKQENILGTINMREHRNSDFIVELITIMKEKNKITNVDYKTYRETVKQIEMQENML